MTPLIRLGAYGEILIHAGHIVSVEAVAELDVRDKPKLPPAYDPPVYAGSTVLLDTGNSISVPQSHEDVMAAWQDAMDAMDAMEAAEVLVRAEEK